jgi:urease subunit alpha
MLYNDSTPEIDVNPETYEVKVNGKITTTDPATKLSLGRLYHLF